AWAFGSKPPGFDWTSPAKEALLCRNWRRDDLRPASHPDRVTGGASGGGSAAIRVAQYRRNHPMSTRHSAQSKSVKTRPQRGARKARREEPNVVVEALSRRKRKEASTPAVGHGVRRQRNPTKTQLCLELLHQPTGASIEELQAATGWQAHSV